MPEIPDLEGYRVYLNRWLPGLKVVAAVGSLQGPPAGALQGRTALPRCGTRITEITAGQRITDFCRKCQPER